MPDARVGVDGRTSQPVSPRLFGGFIEHFGRIIYDGLWDLDAHRVRPAVLDALRKLAPTVLRYPGGCFADSYHWRDGVGPVDRRPRYEEQYWTGFVRWLGLDESLAARFGPPEPNAFGTEEFLAVCDAVGAAPAITANVGTGSAEEAAAWVAHTGGRVKIWFLGNELWGAHELGHLPAADYGERCREFAAAMRAVDPDLTLVAVGALGDRQSADPAWNATVTAAAGDAVDVLSLHHYFPGPDHPGRPLRDDVGDYAQLAAGSARLARDLDRVLAATPMPVSLDEWNIWSHWSELLDTNHRACDALVIAGVYNRLLERSGRVHSAMLSQLVNCLAPIQTRGDDVFVTATHLAARLYREHAGSESMPVTVECDTFEVPPFADAAGDQGFASLASSAGAGVATAPLVDATATRHGAEVTVFLTNRSIDRTTTVEVTGVANEGELVWLAADSPFDRNDPANPERLRLVRRRVDPRAVALPPHTVGALTTWR